MPKIIARGRSVIYTQLDAYNITQTLSGYTFSSDSNGKILKTTTITSQIKVIQNNVEINDFTIGEISVPVGFSAITVNNTTKTVTYVVNANTTSLSDNGAIEIPIIIGAESYALSFNWSKSKVGASGQDAYSISLSTSSFVIPTDKNGKINAPVTTYFDVIAYKGKTQVTPTIGTLPSVTGCSLSVNKNRVTVTFIVGTSLAENGTISIPVVVDGLTFTQSFSYAKAKTGADGRAGIDSNLLDWVNDWNTNKTQIDNQSVISPKIFAGTKNADGTVTGIAIGKMTLPTKETATVTKENLTGIYGFKNGQKTFGVGADGSVQLGRGSQFVKYNPTTGKIEFGADVTLNWTQAAKQAETNALNNAKQYADTKKTEAINVAASDAKTKADAAKSAAINAAATDAANKANNALTSAKEYANKVVDDIQIGGRNLLRRLGEQINKMVGVNGDIAPYTGSSLSIYPISVTAGEQLVFTKTTARPDNAWRYKFVDSEGKVLRREGKYDNIIIEFVPEGAVQLIVSYPTGSEVKIERGNKPTDWTPAPEDLESDIELARQAGIDAQATADAINKKATDEKWSSKLTYIGSTGIYTGTLSAQIIEALRINASQITAGTIDVARLNVAALKSQLITAGNINALTLTVNKGTIGGWTADVDSLFRGTKQNTIGAFTGSSGHITVGSNGIRGFKWRFDSTGAGAIAGGNISWDASGNLVFDNKVTKLWEDAAQNAVDDVQIGGRNLLSDTTTLFSLVGENRNNQVRGMKKFVNGKRWLDLYGPANTFTLSFDWEVIGEDIAVTAAKPQLDGEPYTFENKAIPVIPVTNENRSGKYIYTFTTTTNSSTNSAVGIAVRVDYFIGELHVKNLKLEIGNKPTDWSPAPEDLVGKSEYNTQLKVINDSINSKVAKTDFDALGRRVGSAETTISQHSTQIAAKAEKSSVDSLGTRLSSAEAKITPNAINLTVKSQTETIAEAIGLIGKGKMLYRDPTFRYGINSTHVYNNKNNGTVTITRVSGVAGNPNDSGYCLKIVTTGESTSGHGGFSFISSVKANQVLVTRIVANIPKGSRIVWTSNATGTGSSNKWLTPTEGTGTWAEYIHKLVCGSSGDFNSTSFYYLEGGAKPITWHVAYATVFDITGVDDVATKDEIKSQFTMDTSGISMLGKKISLKGLVTFDSLDTNSQNKINGKVDSTTIIDGGYLKTSIIKAGSITADKIKAGSITSTQIDTANLKAALITAANINALTLTVNKGTIAGWNISASTIAKNNVSLGADGSISNGTKWSLDNAGSGKLANGNISWDTSGNVTFGENVKLQWKKDIDDIQVGGRNYIICSRLGSYTPYNTVPVSSNNGRTIITTMNQKGASVHILTLSIQGFHFNNEIYTVSGYIKIDGEIPSRSVWGTGLASTYGNSLIRDYYDEITGRFIITQKYPGDSAWIFHKKNNFMINQVVEFTDLKFETGNKATDWTPAPEDLESKLTKITDTGIYTGTISANQINAGSISADRLDINQLKSKLITAENINGLTLTVNKGTIGGWNISSTAISKDQVALNADGSIVNGTKWKFNKDGSGQVASGNLSWNALGDIVFKGEIRDSDVYLPEGITVDQKFQVVSGRLESLIEDIRSDMSLEPGNILKNSTFNTDITSWVASADDISFIKVQNKLLWFNDNFYVNKKKVVDIYRDGQRNVLRLLNSSITQSNQEFEFTGDKTEGTYSFTFLYKVVRSGTLKVGVPNTALYEETTLPVTNIYQKYSKVATWDGNGDFLISFTGEILIYGMSLFEDELGSAVVKLSTQIQQNKEQISLRATKEYVDENTLETTKKWESQLTVKANEISSNIKGWVNGTLTNYSTVSQTENSIRAVSNRISTAEDGIRSLQSAGFLTKTTAESTFAAIFASKNDVTAASIVTKINSSGAGEVQIKGDKIKLEGATTINGNFKIDANGNMFAINASLSGTITATTGQIGGFKIDGERLVGTSGNMTINPSTGITFRRSSKRFGSIGSNVLPVSSGGSGQLLVVDYEDDPNISTIVTWIGVGSSPNNSVARTWLNCFHYNSIGWGSKFVVESRYFGDKDHMERTVIDTGQLVTRSQVNNWKGSSGRQWVGLVYDVSTGLIAVNV